MTKLLINDKLIKYNLDITGVSMKKLLKLLIISVLSIACVLGLFACGGGAGKNEEEGIICKKLSGDAFYTVIGYNAEKDENGNVVTILDISAAAQDKYGDENTTVTVGRIRTGAFDGNNTLTKVIVSDKAGDGVDLTIDAGAFKNMRALKEITLPFIGANAKSDAYFNETAPALGDELKATDKERTFGYIFGEDEADYASPITCNYGDKSDMTATFYIPVALTKVTVKAESEINIPMYAFCGLPRITTVNLEGNIKAIGVAAFKNMTALKTVNIPSSVKVIYEGAFEGTTALKTFTFDADSNLNEIKESAFKGTKLTAFDISGTQVNAIGDYAFYGSALTEFTFSATVTTTVGAYAFANSEKLVAVNNMPANVHATAFYGTEIG